MTTRTKAQRFSFCSDCGGRPFCLCDGSPLCEACMRTLLAAKRQAVELRDLRGNPMDLADCPGCNMTREQVSKTGFFGCPSCYSAFRVTVRELTRDRAR